MNKIRIQQAPIKTQNHQRIRIQSLFVKWSLQNVRDLNFSVDSNSISIPNGYYTFSQLKIFLKKNSISIERNPDSTITLTASKAANLKTLGPMLGFSSDQAIQKDIATTSANPANFTNNLDEISILCPFINPDLNYNFSGQHSYLLTTIPIDTTQSLSGTFSSYPKTDILLPVKNYSGQEMTFHVISGGHKEDYTILLTLSIE